MSNKGQNRKQIKGQRCMGYNSDGTRCNRYEGYTKNENTNGLMCPCGGGDDCYCMDHCPFCKSKYQENSCDDEENSYGDDSFVEKDGDDYSEEEYSGESEEEYSRESEEEFCGDKCVPVIENNTNTVVGQLDANTKLPNDDIIGTLLGNTNKLVECLVSDSNNDDGFGTLLKMLMGNVNELYKDMNINCSCPSIKRNLSNKEDNQVNKKRKK